MTQSSDQATDQTDRPSAGHYRHSLPSGHCELDYRFERILGDGGFGITYLATDLRDGQAVAIKEYLPNEVAVRTDNLSVRPKLESERETFDWGLERFLTEAQTLARFDHPNIVRVHRFFKANGTAYMVMSYVDGQSLFDVINHRGTLNERALLDIVFPLLDGLREVHRNQFLHRDIKPENIFIQNNGQPILLDFGAARQAFGDKSRQITTIVTPGYAPTEQYESDGNQGPWTDIYALAGVLYSAVTGTIPVEAPARANAILRGRQDPLPAAGTLGAGRFSDGFLQAIDHGLAVIEDDRPQRVDDWMIAFQSVVGVGRDDQQVVTGSVQENSAAAPEPPLMGNETISLPDPSLAAAPAAKTHRALDQSAATDPARSAPLAPPIPMNWSRAVLIFALTMIAWALQPVLIAAHPMMAFGYNFAPAIFGFGAGLMMALALRIGCAGLTLPGIPIIAAGWMMGILVWFIAFQLSRSLAFAPGLGFKVTVGLASGMIGGGLTGLALYLSNRRLSIIGWLAMACCWAILWAARHYALFIATQNLGRDLARQTVTRTQMDRWLFWLDIGIMALVGLFGLWATLALWQWSRLPNVPRRWR